jgi:hypothetical protein
LIVFIKKKFFFLKIYLLKKEIKYFIKKFINSLEKFYLEKKKIPNVVSKNFRNCYCEIDKKITYVCFFF